MVRHFTLEYWIDEGWYVGRIKEVPGVFSQGETLDELEKNIREAYKLMTEEEEPVWTSVRKRKLRSKCETAGVHQGTDCYRMLSKTAWSKS